MVWLTEVRSVAPTFSAHRWSRYVPGGTSGNGSTIHPWRRWRKKGVLRDKMTAPISEWMLQKIYETPSWSEFDGSAFASPRRVRGQSGGPLKSEKTIVKEGIQIWELDGGSGWHDQQVRGRIACLFG